MGVLEKQTGVDELKTRLRSTWMTGDYGGSAVIWKRRRGVLPAPAHQAMRAVARCGLRRGAVVADCGESGSACDRVRHRDQLAGPSPSKRGRGGANSGVRRRRCGSTAVRK